MTPCFPLCPHAVALSQATLEALQDALRDIRESPSDAARIIRGTTYPLQGPLYWKYEGETLDERRKRMERGE